MNSVPSAKSCSWYPISYHNFRSHILPIILSWSIYQKWVICSNLDCSYEHIIMYNILYRYYIFLLLLCIMMYPYEQARPLQMTPNCEKVFQSANKLPRPLLRRISATRKRVLMSAEWLYVKITSEWHIFRYEIQYHLPHFQPLSESVVDRQKIFFGTNILV